MKLKSHSGTSKRFKRTGGGKLMRRKAGKRHLLTSKSRTRKRRITGAAAVDAGMRLAVSRLLPYNG
ncbi:MAG: 50S ribosomal protein L35 [Nitrospirota bacterium]